MNSTIKKTDKNNSGVKPPYPSRSMRLQENEHPHILVENTITGNTYRIEGDPYDRAIIGPSGPWQTHLRWLLFKGMLKYKGTRYGVPTLYQADEIHSSRFWKVLLAVTPGCRPGVIY